jgi:hypothetical protein
MQQRKQKLQEKCSVHISRIRDKFHGNATACNVYHKYVFVLCANLVINALTNCTLL